VVDPDAVDKERQGASRTRCFQKRRVVVRQVIVGRPTTRRRYVLGVEGLRLSVPCGEHVEDRRDLLAEYLADLDRVDELADIEQTWLDEAEARSADLDPADDRSAAERDGADVPPRKRSESPLLPGQYAASVATRAESKAPRTTTRTGSPGSSELSRAPLAFFDSFLRSLIERSVSMGGRTLPLPF
jgi:hypothetical protein